MVAETVGVATREVVGVSREVARVEAEKVGREKEVVTVAVTVVVMTAEVMVGEETVVWRVGATRAEAEKEVATVLVMAVAMAMEERKAEEKGLAMEESSVEASMAVAWTVQATEAVRMMVSHPHTIVDMNI